MTGGYDQSGTGVSAGGRFNEIKLGDELPKSFHWKTRCARIDLPVSVVGASCNNWNWIFVLETQGASAWGFQAWELLVKCELMRTLLDTFGLRVPSLMLQF